MEVMHFDRSARRDPLCRPARLSVAPMMDCTDRHCRYLHRLLSRHVLLYTEMIMAPALVRGGALHLLRHDPAEHPVAAQLGGGDPAELADATAIARDAGFDEVNLNVGCPSDRVLSGCFGAVLMKSPARTAECVAAMVRATDAPVTVKCRIGIDNQNPEMVLPDFITRIRDAGVSRMQIHARKAWLRGLSPRENREIPPLDYDLVRRMKDRFPDLHVSVNGGIETLNRAEAFLANGLDGVMIGRVAYRSPWKILADVDRRIFGKTGTHKDIWQIVEEMRPYIARHLDEGGRFHQPSRHMLGLFAGCPGARQWRRVLSEKGGRPGAGLEVLDEALSLVRAATGRDLAHLRATT